MDYLFKDVLTNVPENCDITSYYIVDNDLKYVSIHNADLFYLHYVDTDVISDVIEACEHEGEFDFIVISLNKPIESQSSSFENGSRKVKTKTISGNQKTIKHKKSSEREVLTRFITKRKKLF